MNKLFSTANDHAIALARLVLGIVFFMHGAQKALAWFGGFGYHTTIRFFNTAWGIPAGFAKLAIAAEFLGGIALILGFLSRFAALGIGIEMLVAITLVHMRNGVFMNWYGNQKGEGYEYHLFAIAICILIMVKGAGALSVDRALTKG